MIAATLRQMAAPQASVKSEIHMQFAPGFLLFRVTGLSESLPLTPPRSVGSWAF
jgi:hypothetical protein